MTDLEFKADGVDGDHRFTGVVLQRARQEGLWEEEAGDPQNLKQQTTQPFHMLQSHSTMQKQQTTQLFHMLQEPQHHAETANNTTILHSNDPQHLKQ